MDAQYKEDGRGAYVCQKPECIRIAKETALIENVLQISIPISVYSQMAEKLTNQPNTGPETLIGFAVRSKKALMGVTAVVLGTKKGNVRLILLDEKSGSQTQKQIFRVSRDTKTPLLLLHGRRTLEAVTGKINCKCIGITDSLFARTILKNENERKKQNPNSS